jgi:hypothetical protein
MALYELTKAGVRNTLTGAYIPDDQRNTDWKLYQTWLDLGNSVDPLPPVIKPTVDQEYDGQNEWLKAVIQEAGINLVALKARVTTNRL